MDFSNAFRIVNLVVGLAMVAGGISQFFTENNLIPTIVIAVYMIIFGLVTALLEFRIPPQVSRYASFLFSFLGRGIFYVFVGSLFADHDWYRILFSVVIGGVGLAYCVLEFIPSIEPPANMREADGGWGAEQV